VSSGASLASAVVPRVWQGVVYRPLDDPAPARALFDFAAAPWPAGAEVALAWGAVAAGEDGPRLVGAVVAVGQRAVMLHGPVVVAEGGASATAPETGEAGSPAREGATPPLEVAAQLVAAILDHAVAAGAATVFARPQGVDRLWVRFGFIPVPEEVLPANLGDGAGDGLYAWRGGSALWSLQEMRAG
jgi:hypothetical protein